jgi:hypothetical protein
MKKSSPISEDTEFAHWLATSSGQRSYLVEVLHWFHYRTTALKRSWTKEEVLTWELLRSMELLPQSMFLQPLLCSISALSSEAETAVTPLLLVTHVTVYRYPSLQLKGSKRNCRSDIGFGLAEGPTVWVEAKTARFKVQDLREQLEQQREALSASLQSLPTALVTLLPAFQAVPGIPNLSWHEVMRVFEAGVVALRSTVTNEDIRRGYETLAIEMIQRITSHPNGIVGTNVVLPDAAADGPLRGNRLDKG